MCNMLNMKVSLFGKLIREARLSLGLTQQELAHRAAVSLATLQNIEAGRANPELNTVSRLAESVGYRLSLTPHQPRIDDLIPYGLPLMSETPGPRIRPTRQSLIEILNLSAPTWLNRRLGAREHDALIAFLSALRDHFPSVWKELAPNIRESMKKQRPVRAKLRRMALSFLAEYL